MESGVFVSQLLELNFCKVTPLWTKEAGENGISTIFAVDDFISVHINVSTLLWVAVQPCLYLCPPILEFGLRPIISAWVCENLNLK